jgi:hypothetical protein
MKPQQCILPHHENQPCKHLDLSFGSKSDNDYVISSTDLSMTWDWDWEDWINVAYGPNGGKWSIDVGN